ncbi:thioredoxin family protein [Halomicrococcus gelatinilyticus]|uniref:thioredoxin family protein n=1 Tax=Halomicrococcus gelatinilyticus TaxID=1702103 RepID=UPI002E0D9B22
MKITIYGPDGCSNCSQLAETTRNVVEEHGFDADVEKESDTATLAAKGIMSTPGFEIDDEMVLSGSTPSEQEIKELIEERL